MVITVNGVVGWTAPGVSGLSWTEVPLGSGTVQARSMGYALRLVTDASPGRDYRALTCGNAYHGPRRAPARKEYGGVVEMPLVTETCQPLASANRSWWWTVMEAEPATAAPRRRIAYGPAISVSPGSCSQAASTQPVSHTAAR